MVSEKDLLELKKELLLQFTFDHSLLVKKIEKLEKEIKKIKNKK